MKKFENDRLKMKIKKMRWKIGNCIKNNKQFKSYLENTTWNIDFRINSKCIFDLPDKA